MPTSMATPTSESSSQGGSPAAVGVLLGSTRAMASDVTVHGIGADPRAERRARQALEVFHDVESACTRFDPNSPLMRINDRPDRWHEVPPILFLALDEAHRAHQRTKGRFDPRVFGDLVRLGYDRSFALTPRDAQPATSSPGPRPCGPWRPRFRGGRRPMVEVGPHPVDLGGIGKGLALRWASERLADQVHEHLIAAGGDIICQGAGPAGDGWRVSVEDLRDGDTPLAVLALTDQACATSSVRVRRWRCGGRPVHHLVDPRSGRPGGAGLLAVTVVAPDPADAEVTSKTLFLHGARDIAARAERCGAAAFWVTTDGRTGETKRFTELVVWRAA